MTSGAQKVPIRDVDTETLRAELEALPPVDEDCPESRVTQKLLDTEVTI